MPFRSDVDLLSYVEDPDASAILDEYRRNFTGWYFEEFAGRQAPNEILPSDLVAVTMLSVDVPARAAIALLHDAIPGHEGRVGECLRAIPAEAQLWEAHDYISERPAQELWRLLRSLDGMGRTKTSKLLAAKRPYLFPIFDSVVGHALFEDPAKDFVLQPWRDAFSGTGSAALVSECAWLRDAAGFPTDFSLLRILDILIWMKHRTR